MLVIEHKDRADDRLTTLGTQPQYGPIVEGTRHMSAITSDHTIGAIGTIGTHSKARVECKYFHTRT